MTMADALSLLRLVLALVFPALLAYRTPLALTVWALAATTDFADGRVARRRGSSPRGPILDVVADVAFVLGGLVAAAELRMVPVVTPIAVGCSVVAYALASARLSADTASVRLARSRLGHAAGIANWVCVGCCAGSIAFPGALWATLLPVAGLATAGLNLSAVAARLLPAQLAGRPS